MTDRSVRPWLRLAPLLVLVVSTGASVVTTAAEANAALSEQRGAATHVIVFREGVDVDAAAEGLARAHGLEVTRTYRHALRGMAAVVPEGRLKALGMDPRVNFIDPNIAYTVAEQIIPTGIDRIEADKNPNANGVSIKLDVAIIDTGINEHEDLNYNATRCINFSGGSPNNCNDGYGHGTHVAGTVGALDNGKGVIGVAPGVRLWSVRVCNNGGICLTSNMIAGLDWVAGKKADYKNGIGGGVNFAVANMSLGTSDDLRSCELTTSSLHKAVCGLVNSGVPLALAAGNSAVVKNAYPEVLAVSAVADFDGKAGGAGTATCRSDEDDTLANFSNFGPEVDIAAPGVCILSTSSGGGYVLGSGTSMAAPHVAGAVALYLHVNKLLPATNAAEVDLIEDAIIKAALPQGDMCGYTNDHVGEGSVEPLLFVNGGAFGGDGACEVATAVSVTDIAVTSVSAPSSAVQGDVVQVDVTVENVGNQDVTADIVVNLRSDNATPGFATDDIAIGQQTIVGGLTAGASTLLKFAWDTAGVNTGDHTLTASQNFADDNAGNDSYSTSITITEPGAGVTVLSITPNSMKVDSSIDVTITGSGFQIGAEVSFENGTGPAPTASDVVVVDINTISATITAKSGGPPRNRVWDVRVSNPDGSTGVFVGGFTVTP